LPWRSTLSFGSAPFGLLVLLKYIGDLFTGDEQSKKYRDQKERWETYESAFEEGPEEASPVLGERLFLMSMEQQATLKRLVS